MPLSLDDYDWSELSDAAPQSDSAPAKAAPAPPPKPATPSYSFSDLSDTPPPAAKSVTPTHGWEDLSDTPPAQPAPPPVPGMEFAGGQPPGAAKPPALPGLLPAGDQPSQPRASTPPAAANPTTTETTPATNATPPIGTPLSGAQIQQPTQPAAPLPASADIEKTRAQNAAIYAPIQQRIAAVNKQGDALTTLNAAAAAAWAPLAKQQTDLAQKATDIDASRSSLDPKNPAQADAFNAKVNAYEAARTSFNAAVDDYNKQYAGPAKAASDKFHAAQTSASSALADYKAKYEDPFNAQVGAYNATLPPPVVGPPVLAGKPNLAQQLGSTLSTFPPVSRGTANGPQSQAPSFVGQRALQQAGISAATHWAPGAQPPANPNLQQAIAEVPPAAPAYVPLVSDFFEGLPNIMAGMQKMKDPAAAALSDTLRFFSDPGMPDTLQPPRFTSEQAKQAAQGAHQAVTGAFETAMPLMGAAAVASPLEAAYAFGRFALAQQATEKGLQAVGLDKDYAALAGDVAGIGLAGGGRVLVGKLDAAIAEHNLRASRLVDAERSSGMQSEKNDDVYGGQRTQVQVHGPAELTGFATAGSEFKDFYRGPATVEYVGSAPSGRAAFRVIDPQGNPLFRGDSSGLNDWIAKNRAEAQLDPAGEGPADASGTASFILDGGRRVTLAPSSQSPTDSNFRIADENGKTMFEGPDTAAHDWLLKYGATPRTMPAASIIAPDPYDMIKAGRPAGLKLSDGTQATIRYSDADQQFQVADAQGNVMHAGDQGAVERWLTENGGQPTASSTAAATAAQQSAAGIWNPAENPFQRGARIERLPNGQYRVASPEGAPLGTTPEALEQAQAKWDANRAALEESARRDVYRQNPRATAAQIDARAAGLALRRAGPRPGSETAPAETGDAGGSDIRAAGKPGDMSEGESDRAPSPDLDAEPVDSWVKDLAERYRDIRAMEDHLDSGAEVQMHSRTMQSTTPEQRRKMLMDNIADHRAIYEQEWAQFGDEVSPEAAGALREYVEHSAAEHAANPDATTTEAPADNPATASFRERFDQLRQQIADAKTPEEHAYYQSQLSDHIISAARQGMASLGGPFASPAQRPIDYGALTKEAGGEPVQPGTPQPVTTPTPTGNAAAPASIDTGETHDYSSTQANLPDSIAAPVRAFATTIPADQLSEKSGEGEQQPHITVRYGNPGTDPAPIQKALDGEGPITATLGKTSIFHTDDGDVLKVSVESPDLHRLNAKVGEAVEHTGETFPDYKPHVTIAYLKKGEGAQYDGKDIPGVTGQTITLPSVTFSGKDGKQTEIPLIASAPPERTGPGTPQPQPPPPAPGLAGSTQQPAQGEPNWVGNMSPHDIHVDAPRFQFKQDVGQHGVSTKLKDAQTYNPVAGGILLVWKDPANGKTYVVNGHHRLDLAKRLNAPQVTVRYIDAKDAAEARLVGAMTNIGEDQGTSVDAAKVFRDSGKSVEQLAQDHGLVIKGKVASDGLALSKLSDPLFRKVAITGELSPARGAAIGAGVPNHADQEALSALLDQWDKKGKDLTDRQVAELIRMNQQAPTITETPEEPEQGDIFGRKPEEITRSLLREKAQVSDYVRQRLAREKKLFSLVGNEGAAETLTQTGNVIKTGENAAQAEQANQGQVLYDKLSVHTGPIDDILNRAAEKLAKGVPSVPSAKEEAYTAIRAELTAQLAKLTGGSQKTGGSDEGHGGQGPVKAGAGQPGDTGSEPEVEAAEPEIPGETPLPAVFRKYIESLPPEMRDRAKALAQTLMEDGSTDKLDISNRLAALSKTFPAEPAPAFKKGDKVQWTTAQGETRTGTIDDDWGDGTFQVDRDQIAHINGKIPIKGSSRIRAQDLKPIAQQPAAADDVAAAAGMSEEELQAAIDKAFQEQRGAPPEKPEAPKPPVAPPQSKNFKVGDRVQVNLHSGKSEGYGTVERLTFVDGHPGYTILRDNGEMVSLKAQDVDHALNPPPAPAKKAPPTVKNGDIVVFDSPQGSQKGNVVATYSDGQSEVRIPAAGDKPARSVYVKPDQIRSVNGVAVTPPAPKTKVGPPSAPKKLSPAKQREAANAKRREVYAPGNVIYVDYWKQYDKVLDYKENDGAWKVQVIRSDKAGTPEVGAQPRWHSTDPGKDVVVGRVPAAPAPAPPANPLAGARTAARDRLRAKHEKPPLASQGNRTSPGSVPDPLSIRRITSVAYDPNGSHSLTEAESQVDYQAPKGGGEPTLWVNRQAVVTLLRAGEWPVLAERHGMTFEEQHSKATVDGLRKMAESASDPHQRKALEDLSRAILRASDLETSPRPIAVVQAGPEMTRDEIVAAQQEEWDHIAGIRLGGGTIEGLIDYEAVRRAAPEEVAIAEAALQGGNYGEPAHYAHEIYVRLLRQRFAELDLSPEQAKKLGSVYATILSETHGEAADQIVDALADAYTLEGPTHQQGGRDRGAPEHGTPPARQGPGPSRLPGRTRPPLSQEQRGAASPSRTIDPQDLIDLATIGASHILDGATEYNEWTQRLMADVGDLVDAIANQSGQTPEDLLRKVHKYSASTAKKHGAEVAPAPPAAPAPVKPAGAIGVVNAVYNKLKAGESLGNITELNKLAEEHFGASRTSGQWTPKDAFDAMEAGINKYLLERGKALMAMDPIEGLAELRKLMDRITSQASVRTEDQLAKQQFSTPPTESYVVARVADLKPSDVVLEPSAGNGGIAVWPKAIGAQVHVNEISDRRAEMLQAAGIGVATKHDAEYINALLDRAIRPTVVLMNPPFSASDQKGHEAANRSIYGFNHVNQALQRLAPNGRLVVILGGGIANDTNGGASLQTGPSGKWFDKIAQAYNVRANIRVSGKEYQKYGTTFATRIIVIDKDGPTPSQTKPNSVKTWDSVKQGNVETLEEAYNLLKDVAATRPQVEPVPRGDQRLGQHKPGAGVASDQDLVRGGSSGLQPGGGGTGENVEPAGEPRIPASGDGKVSPGTGDQLPGGVEPGPEPAGHPELTAANDSQGGPENADDQRAAGLALERNEEPAEADSESEADNGPFVPYRPSIAGPSHPGDIVETRTMATVPMPEIIYRPNLPDWVLTNGGLSAVQLEAIALMGQQNSIVLPSGAYSTALVGDGTGLGKGRIAAGILWDNYRQGRKRLVWVSEKWDLLQDAIRDLRGISLPPGTMLAGPTLLRGVTEENGKNKIAPDAAIKTLIKYKGGQEIKHDGMLFTTYSLVRSEDSNNNERSAQLEQYLRGDDDGEGAYLLMDESHNLKNATGVTQSQTGQKFVALIENLPHLRTGSLSATAATDVNNLGYLGRLGLWGPGTAFPNGFGEFQTEIAPGGIAAMEMVARELKAQGKYVSRTLSYKGVTYSQEKHELTPEQKELYKTATQAWASVVQNVEHSIAHNTNGGKRQAGRFMALFAATQQRFFNLLISAIKTPTAIELANKALADGKSVVITLVNTNEAAQNREKAKQRDMEEGDEEPDFDFGPKEMLVKLVQDNYPTQQYRDDVDSEGKPIKVAMYTTDSQGRRIPVVNPAAVAARDALIAQIDRDLHMPENPLDILINSLGGESKVAEMTGRKEKFDPSTNKFVKRGDPQAKQAEINLYELRAFQGGKKRVAILSSAAGTGISLHASNDAKNQQKRYHITLQVGWSADKAMQMLGRTHRTNQAHPPEYAMLTSDLGGEQRFVSTIARRLGSLGALTKGQKNAAGGSAVAENANIETDEGKTATNAFYGALLRNLPVPGTNLAGMQILTDLRVLKMENGTLTVSAADRVNVTRLLNRLLALEPNVQNPVYNYFFRMFEAAVHQAEEAGTLDTGVKTLPGDEFQVKESRAIAKDPKTGAETFYYPVDAKIRTNRVSPEDLEKRIDDNQPRNPQILRSMGGAEDDGRLILAWDAPPITSASGTVTPAFFTIRPDNGHRAKIPQSTIRARRFEEVSAWARAEALKAKREAAEAQRTLDRDRKETERITEYARQARAQDVEWALRDSQDRLNNFDITNPPAQLAANPDRAQNRAQLWNRVEELKANLAEAQKTELPQNHYQRARLANSEKEAAQAQKELADAEAIAKDPQQWAKDRWKEAYDAAPSHITVEHHLIGGAVMKYWNPIRDAAHVRDSIYTTADSKTGQRVVGIDIPPTHIRALLDRITGGRSTVDAHQLLTDVMRNNMTYTLEGNIQVRRGRVGRENVIQLIPPTQDVARTLTGMGVISERGISPIYYIPNHSTGPYENQTGGILGRVMTQYPVKPDQEGPAPLQSRALPEDTPEAVKQRSIEQLQADPQGFVDRYRARFGDHFNPDNAAELFPDYSASPEARARYRAAVSFASGWVADEAFKQRLAEPDKGAVVVFTAGGTASGKSTFASPESIAGKIVFDSTFSNYELSKQRLQEALDSGRRVEVRYMYRDPMEAWEAAKVRAANEGAGRTITPKAHAATHSGAASTVARLAAAFAHNPGVWFQYSELSTANGIAPGGIELTEKGNYTNLRERLEQYDAEHANPNASEVDAGAAGEYEYGGARRAQQPGGESRSGSLPDRQGSLPEEVSQPRLPQQQVDDEDPTPLQSRALPGDQSLFNEDEEDESRTAAQTHEAKLLGDQLTAQIKSGMAAKPAKKPKKIPNRGLFDDDEEAPEQTSLFSRAIPAPGFYSQLERTIEAKMPARALPQQIIAILDNPQNGVKPDERLWTDIDTWLKAQKGPTSKQAVLDYLKANEVRVEETELGGDAPGEEALNEFEKSVDEASEGWTGIDWGETDESTGYTYDARDDDVDSVAESLAEHDRYSKYEDDAKWIVAKVKELNDDDGQDARAAAEDWEVKDRKTGYTYNRNDDNVYDVAEAIAKRDRYSEYGGDAERIADHVNKVGADAAAAAEHGANAVTAARAGNFEDAKSEIDAARRLEREYGDDPAWSKAGDALDELAAGGTKYPNSWQIPGGQNYRELVMFEPGTSRTEQWGEGDVNHFGDIGEGRTVGWIRFNDRTGPDGEKILHVEEIQDKRRQEGRTKGYRTELPKLSPGAFIDQYLRLEKFDGAPGAPPTYVYTANQAAERSFDWDAGEPVGGFERTEAEALASALREVTGRMERVGVGVPAAPFSKTWHELAFRRALRYAAEHGYDRLTWTTGEQQAARYDLSKQIDALHYAPLADGRFHVDAIRDGSILTSKTGTPAELEDFIGKDVTQKIVDGEGVPLRNAANYKILEGLDLKAGGEGMKGFYDKILPNYASRYVKKWGATVGETKLPGVGGKVHSIDITPAMRESVMQGQPLFARKSKNPGQLSLFDQRSTNTDDLKRPAQRANSFEVNPQDIPHLKDAPQSRAASPTIAQDRPYWDAAEAQAGSLNGRPAMFVNNSGMNIVLNRMGPMGANESAGYTLGLTLTPEEWRNILDAADTVQYPNAGGFDTALIRVAAEIRTALGIPAGQPAPADLDRPLIVVQAGPSLKAADLKRVAEEEYDHSLQMELPGGLRGLPIESLETPEGKTAAATLARGGYPKLNPGSRFYEHNRQIIAAEIGVRLMRPGRWRELGLTAQEAHDLSTAYILGLAKHGDKADAIIDQIRDATIQETEASLQSGHRSGGGQNEKAGEVSPAKPRGPPARTQPDVPGEQGDQAEVNPASKTPLQSRKPFDFLTGNQDPDELARNYSGLGAFKDKFVRNLSQLEKVSEKAHAAAVSAATARAQTAALVRSAAPRVVEAMGKDGPSFLDFRRALIESRLRGLRERWADMADETATASDFDLRGAFGNWMAHLLKNIREVEPPILSGEVLPGPPQSPAETAAALLERADYDGLRAFASNAFHQASGRVARMMTHAEYDRITQNPGFDRGLQAYKNLFESAIAGNHETNEGVFSDALGPLDTYYPLVPITSEEQAAHKQGGRSGRAVPYRKPKNIANAFATGHSEAYDPSMEGFEDRLRNAFRVNNKAALLQTLQDQHLLQPLEKGEAAPEFITLRGVPYKAVKIEMKEDHTISPTPTKAAVYVPPRYGIIPAWLESELRPILDRRSADLVDPEGLFARIMAKINKATLAGPADAAIHSANLMGTLVANTPFLGKSLAGKIIGGNPLTKRFAALFQALATNPSTEESATDIMAAARLGLIPEKYASVTYSRKFAELTGAELDRRSFAPMLYGPNGVDIRARLVMYRLAKSINPDVTPKQMYLFVNQLGNYTRALQGKVERSLKESGWSPFYTAGSTMVRNGVNAWTGQGPMPKDGKGLRFLTALTGGAAGLMALWILAHKAYRNEFPWEDPHSKFLSVRLTPEDRRSWLARQLYGDPSTGEAYVGLGFFSPLVARGARAMGITGAYNTHQAGGSIDQVWHSALAGAVDAAMQPVFGPPARMGWIGLSGTQPNVTGFRDDRGKPMPQFSPLVKAQPPGAAGFAKQHIEAPLLSMNSFLLNVAAATGLSKGLMRDADDQANHWLRMATDLVFPQLAPKPSEGLGQAEFLARQRNAEREAPRTELKQQIADALRDGDREKAVVMARQAKRDGMVTDKDLDEIEQRSKVPKTLAQFDSLPISAAIEVMQSVTPEEKALFIKPLTKRLDRDWPKLPDEEHGAILEAIKAAHLTADDFNRARQ